MVGFLFGLSVWLYWFLLTCLCACVFVCLIICLLICTYFLLLYTVFRFSSTVEWMYYCLFFREVLACSSLLNMPDRVDWKACKVSMEEEATMATAFRKKFQPYDFNFS